MTECQVGETGGVREGWSRKECGQWKVLVFLGMRVKGYEKLEI